MLNELIARKKNQWLRSGNCPVTSLLSYIRKQGYLRRPQVEAIETYLYLKIEGENKPLWKLFSDNDIWHKEDYLNWMYENLAAIKSVMSDTASIYVHLDWHIGHYVKILMDEVFGEENFINEYRYEDEKGRFQIRGKAIKGSPVDRADGLSIDYEEKYPGMTYRQLTAGKPKNSGTALLPQNKNRCE